MAAATCTHHNVQLGSPPEMAGNICQRVHCSSVATHAFVSRVDRRFVASILEDAVVDHPCCPQETFNYPASLHNTIHHLRFLFKHNLCTFPRRQLIERRFNARHRSASLLLARGRDVPGRGAKMLEGIATTRKMALPEQLCTFLSFTHCNTGSGAATYSCLPWRLKSSPESRGTIVTRHLSLFVHGSHERRGLTESIVVALLDTYPADMQGEQGSRQRHLAQCRHALDRS